MKVDEKSVEFLFGASRLYNESCPELSRFFLQRHLDAQATTKHQSSRPSQGAPVCPYCCQWLGPDNHRVRIKPKKRPSATVQRILRKSARGRRLSLTQRKLLHNYQQSTSVLMATCHTCNKTSRHKGMNREFLATVAKSHSTPGSSGKHKTPPSINRSNMMTPKTPGKDKTPVHTPRSSTSSSTPGSGSSKPPSKAKNWVGRLGKILMRDDKQGNKKGGLKDFLSSL